MYSWGPCARQQEALVGRCFPGSARYPGAAEARLGPMSWLRKHLQASESREGLREERGAEFEGRAR